VRYRVRYFTRDEKGETRRERNARFSVETPPPPPIDQRARYLLDWFDDLSAARQNTDDGPLPIEWDDMNAWRNIRGHVVGNHDWTALRKMERAYLSEMAAERAAMFDRINAAAGKK